MAAVRLQKIKQEFGAKVDLTWKPFPLLPGDHPRAMSVSHINTNRMRAQEEEKGLNYQPWPESKPLPTSSLPALEASKCAQLQGDDAFDRFHLAAMKAYFEDNRDISQRDELIAIARDCSLDIERFISDLDSGVQRTKVLEEYAEAAAQWRFSGVPTAIFDGKYVLEAALPLEVYRRAVEKLSQ